MKIIHRPRAAGKTTELIKLASEAPYRLIVCPSKMHVKMIWNMAMEMLNIKVIKQLPPMPITYDEFLNKKYFGKSVNGFLMDDVDWFIQSFTRIRIEAVSISGEPETYQDKLNRIPEEEYKRMLRGEWIGENEKTDS